ncbi:MAG: pyridoxal phosphate-dependent aminotransferase [Candidatus Margulisiibacteriota bacterium]
MEPIADRSSAQRVGSPLLSKITDGLIGQPMFNLLAKATEKERSGQSVIHFEIGDPNFDSPVHVKEAAKRSLDNNQTHYTNSMGVLEFRETVAEYTLQHWGFKPRLEQVLICPANAIIDFVARCAVNPGEEVIYPDPGFPTYHSVLNYNGMVPVGIPLRESNGFCLDPAEINEKITERTRLIIVNTPQNPTGAVMKEAELLEIARIAAEHNIYLLSDEVYAKIVFEKRHFSPAVVDRCRERTIILNSLSKIYAMSGWRIGYAVGPEPLIKKMGLLLQTIFSCLPAFVQHGGVAAILGDQAIVNERNIELRSRRDALVAGLNELPGVSCATPDGAFYAFPNIRRTGMSSDEFSDKMLEDAGVCVLPGNCFGKFGEGYVRMCYASTRVPQIETALAKMKKIL